MKTQARLQAVLSVLFLSSITATSAVAAVTTGFSKGNEFSITRLEGDLTVHCEQNGQFDNAYYRCTSSILDPTDMDYFVTEPGGSADSVTLTAHHEDGSTREKNSNFDSSTGRSKSRINLWILTLFQRPLLHGGVNQIHYELKKGQKVEQQGDFTATVSRGPTLGCRSDHIFSNIMNDCRSSTNICGEYFRRQNYCR